jgi:hypothetical protein
MTTLWFTGLRRVFAILMVVGVLLFPASSVFADGNGATTFTQTFHNATQTLVDVVPCRGYPATINLTYNGVFHTTVNKAGDFWVTGTMTGDVVAVPLIDPSLPTFTGHFTTWFGGAQNNQNFVNHSTFTVHATGIDGSTIQFHDTMHLSTNANGVVFSFDKPVCG